MTADGCFGYVTKGKCIEQSDGRGQRIACIASQSDDTIVKVGIATYPCSDCTTDWLEKDEPVFIEDGIGYFTPSPGCSCNSTCAPTNAPTTDPTQVPKNAPTSPPSAQSSMGAYGACSLIGTEYKYWGLFTNYTAPPSDSYDFGDDFEPQHITSGMWYHCIISSNGAVRIWGEYAFSDNYGQLGSGNTDWIPYGSILQDVDLGTNYTVESGDAGYWHSCFYGGG